MITSWLVGAILTGLLVQIGWWLVGPKAVPIGLSLLFLSILFTLGVGTLLGVPVGNSEFLGLVFGALTPLYLYHVTTPEKEKETVG